jgi:hypothetical protein
MQENKKYFEQFNFNKVSPHMEKSKILRAKKSIYDSLRYETFDTYYENYIPSDIKYSTFLDLAHLSTFWYAWDLYQWDRDDYCGFTLSFKKYNFISFYDNVKAEFSYLHEVKKKLLYTILLKKLLQNIKYIEYLETNNYVYRGRLKKKLLYKMKKGNIKISDRFISIFFEISIIFFFVVLFLLNNNVLTDRILFPIFFLFIIYFYRTLITNSKYNIVYFLLYTIIYLELGLSILFTIISLFYLFFYFFIVLFKLNERVSNSFLFNCVYKYYQIIVLKFCFLINYYACRVLRKIAFKHKDYYIVNTYGSVLLYYVVVYIIVG